MYHETLQKIVEVQTGQATFSANDEFHVKRRFSHELQASRHDLNLENVKTLSKKRIEVSQIWITRRNSKKDDKSEIIEFSQEFT